MAMHIIFQNLAGASLGVSVERFADGFFLDFTDLIFRASPAILIATLPEGVAPFAGRYRRDISPTTQAHFPDGGYLATVHDLLATDNVVGMVGITMADGDDSLALDKTGFALGPAGLDSIAVEAGINVRQSLSPILAGLGGVLSGAGSGTIVLKGGNSTTTRITAITDTAGNRLAITLNLPA